jgi:hypothetical protein
MTVKFTRNNGKYKKDEKYTFDEKTAFFFIENGFAVESTCSGDCKEAKKPCTDCAGKKKRSKKTVVSE